MSEQKDFKDDYVAEIGDYYFEKEEVRSSFSWRKTFTRAGALHFYDGEKWITEEPDGAGCYSFDCGTPRIDMKRDVESKLKGHT